MLGLSAILSAPAWARAAVRELPAGIRLAATWRAEHGYRAGVLSKSASGAGTPIEVVAAVETPTRAHGLLLESGGTLLTVARRPGDWLLRWDREGRVLAMHWVEPRRAFTGHALAGGDGRTLYTTETDLDTGAGLVGVRDSATLEKRAEWPTHGVDPHQLVGDLTSGSEACLIVANGGVATRPETGRMKHDLERMDSSLVRLDAGTGELRGQWRLQDRRLSLRHLAWGASGKGEPLLGVALQAEHDGAETKAKAPVLALFDGHALRAVPARVALAGYGGDIASLDGRFAVSCPRAQGVAVFSADGAWRGFLPLDEGCAIASTSREIIVGGRSQLLGMNSRVNTPELVVLPPEIRLDNHWLVLN